MMIQLNERALFALGFDRAGVDALRHLVRQIGSIVGGQTLPETVMEVALQDTGGAVAAVAELRKEVESLRVQIESLAHMAELSKRIDSLQQQVDSERNSVAELAELRKFAQARAIEDMFPAQLTDWEHPGSIGLQVPNSGAFTTLSATGTASFGKAGAAGRIELKRASDGAAVGTDTMNGNTRQIDNQAGDIVLLRGSTERLRVAAAGAAVSGTFSVTGQLTVSTATGNPPFIVASTTQVSNLYVERAALADHATNAAVLTSGTAYPPNATDLPTAITLVNAIRAANLSKNV